MKRLRRVRSTYPETEAAERAVKEDAARLGIECDIVNVREAKDQLSSLLDRASKGEYIVITSDGRPKAMIVRYRPFVQGNPWTSKAEIRKKTLIVEDSAPILRAEKDAGY